MAGEEVGKQDVKAGKQTGNWGKGDKQNMKGGEVWGRQA